MKEHKCCSRTAEEKVLILNVYGPGMDKKENLSCVSESVPYLLRKYERVGVARDLTAKVNRKEKMLKKSLLQYVS